MSIAQNYPAISPSLSLDFANAKQLPPQVTFTRATTATYYDGSTTAKAEQNLLTYSQEFDNAAWIPTSTTVTANSTTAPDGTTTADTLRASAATASHLLQRLVTTIASEPQGYSIYAKYSTAQYIAFGFTSGGLGSAWAYVTVDIQNGTITQTTNGGGAAITISGSITSVGSGWYRISVLGNYTQTLTYPTVLIVDTGTPSFTGFGNYAWTAAGTEAVFIWGAQMEQRTAVTAYTATTTAQITNYIPVLLTAGGGQPRFDHNPTTSESLGLLIEEQRTNIALYSAVNTTGWTAISLTLTNNYAVGPDGTTSAGYLADDTNNVQHSLYQTLTLANATSYSFSAYIKSYGRNYAEIVPFGTPTGNTVVGASFNLSNGTVSATTSAVTATITSVGNGWYRCSVIYTTVASGAANFNIFPSNGPNIGDRVYTGNGFSGLLVWGAQLEANSFATSYIPTTSAAATRAADNASMTGANFSSWYAQGFGTLYAEYALLQITSGSTIFSPVEMNDGTQSKFFQSGPYTSAGNTANVFTKNASSLAANSTTALVSRNGATLGAYTDSGLNVGGLTQLVLGVGRIYYSAPSRIKKMAYYPVVATQAQLNALTS